ncbi:hypothetical protein BCF50_1052 [Chryseobacterium daecheongense]|uniref:Uncharacterized protein n=1 Tax=Chryseobacterium daecheongense TaxID=192389 RepID=A0ABY2FZT7_9FLAO|nr:hypothetical protein BCF50_1052 [Chryseobacterium daecheongense]
MMGITMKYDVSQINLMIEDNIKKPVEEKSPTG